MLSKPCKNENGFILVLAMAMLVILSIIGVAGTRTSTIDLKISGNERTMAQNFQIMDSLWQLGALWTNSKSNAPESVNRSLIGTDTAADFDTKEVYRIVRNYGDGTASNLNNDFPAANRDGTVSNEDFWFRVASQKSKNTKSEGSNNYYTPYDVDVDLEVAQRNHVKVRLTKLWRSKE